LPRFVSFLIGGQNKHARPLCEFPLARISKSVQDSRLRGPIRAGSRSSSIYAEGVVTRTEFSGAQFGSANSGSGRGCGSPSPERFLSEDAERAAGGEMALDVEGVEDYGVNR
jgi:hypothetical protein